MKYIKAGKRRMAQVMRTRLEDIFTEAQQVGKFPADKPNPATVVKKPTVKTQRARLMLEDWNAIYNAAEQHLPKWVVNGMLLALVTGQRLEDVGNMKFKDVKNGYLEVIQSKTGNPVRISVQLHLQAINMSLKDVIKRCRDGIVSPFLIHHKKAVGRAQPGSKVRAKSISNGFRSAREISQLTWEAPAPSFHEIRSLCKRLYDLQGVDTKTLLGHKTEKMAAEYADARGYEWGTVDG